MTVCTSRRAFLVLATGLVLGATGCSGTIPRDAQGTLERATGGVLHIGVSENPPWTRIGPDGTVGGTESVLARAMTDDRLDLLVAGLTSDHPWSSEIASTRPYATSTAEDGATRKRVLGVRPGENALQVALERHLAESTGEL